MKRELLLGAGRNLTKKITVGGATDWSNLTTLDINPAHCPDICADLEELPYRWADDDSYDEIHGYEVLEHTGKQGDWKFFFAQWRPVLEDAEAGRLLRGGIARHQQRLAMGRSGHTRAVTPESFVFLCQPKYAQVGVTAMSDYRFVWRGDFETIHAEIRDGAFIFVLQAVKPSRVSLTSPAQ